MEYYIVLQDTKIVDYPEAIGICNVFPRDLLKNVDDDFESDPKVFYIKKKPDIRCVDFIQNPFPMVSDKFKKIIEEYQSETLFKPIMLADIKRMNQYLYWIAAPRKIECLSPETEFNKDGSIKKLVIDVEKFFAKNVFMIEGILENFLIISRELVERLLREDFDGMIFKRIEREGE